MWQKTLLQFLHYCTGYYRLARVFALYLCQISMQSYEHYTNKNMQCLAGCLMDKMEIQAKNIRRLKNVVSHTKCANLCKRWQKCSLWTYATGSCKFKNNMVYTVKNSLVTSGERNCNNSGNILQQ